MLLNLQILVRALLLGLSMITLAGCGQSGALYLPQSAAAASQPTSLEGTFHE
jgi:predicted small lipoprotein YifL